MGAVGVSLLMVAEDSRKPLSPVAKGAFVVSW
jgi:hypothetical protein